MPQPAPDLITQERRPSIAIIGGGFAGLRCADVLLQANFSVTVFEARDRLGGRVAQSDHLGHTVDLGPNWIHGSLENPIFRVAKETGTELYGWGEEEAIVDSRGQLLDPDEAEEYGRLLWDDGLIAAAFEYSERCTETIDVDRSLYSFFEEKVHGMFTELPSEVASLRRRTLLDVSQMWGAYVGAPIHKQSLKFFWLEKTVGGENPFVASTYAQILEAVTKPVKKSASVRLGHRVIKITNGLQDVDRRICVRTDRGTEETFDDVVVTVPLGYLKRNHLTLFEPPLPARVRSAMEHLGYGNLDKVYITFPSAFWNRPSSNQAEQRTQTFREGFVNFLPPAYAADTNPARWDQQAMNLAALPPSTAHPTLLFYVYGACSTHVAALATEADASEKLIDFLTPYFSRLPNYSSSDPTCAPSKVLATAWANDEFAGYGSYSNFQVGLEAGDEDIEALREGCSERGLWFAGEHTAPFDALGTTTGAYLSGERVARSILQKCAPPSK